MRSALCAVLAVSLLAPDAVAAEPASSKTAETSQDNKSLHALNRFTFGPRPGDEKSVNSQGLNQWFETQLHPEKIDDSALDRRLDQFPAMRLSQTELMERFPSPLHMRFFLRTNTSLPKWKDPVMKAVYSDYMAHYRFALRLAAVGKKPEAASAEMIEQAYEQEAATASDKQKPVKAVRGKRSGLEVAADEPLPPSSMTREQAQQILSLPPNDRFERIVELSPGDNLRFIGFTAKQMPAVVEGFTPQQREILGAMVNPLRIVSGEVLQERLMRDIYSERQLQAVMADFWLNHFSVYIRKNQNEPYMLSGYEHDVILPNALGNFEHLLVATAMSPAMLMYLDNYLSVGPDSVAAERAQRAKQMRPDGPGAQRAPSGLNENYARELMELHTVGVDGGYTQKDVIEVAKCFTGWTLSRPYVRGDGDQGMLTFRFDPSRHEGGSKTVMGVTIPEGGMKEGLMVLHLLANSPQTAHFVSQKLAVRFVSDTPPPALVNRMASTFLKTHGDIPSVLRTMFHSPEFWNSSTYNAKLKTPQEFLVSAVRASQAEVSNDGALVQAVGLLGMPLYGMQTPQGYSWKSEDWVSSGALVNRMNFALVLAGDHIRGVNTNWASLLTSDASSQTPTPATERQLEQAVLGQQAQEHTRNTVMEQFTNPELSQSAQKSFSAAADSDAAPSMDMSMKPKGVAASYRQRRQGAGGFSFQAGPPSTPLASMAGLLLGSPDFQRR